MTFRTLLVVKAAVCLVFGVILLLAPASLFAMLGASPDASGLFPAREYGAAMIGTLLLTWLAKNVAAADARRAILWDLLVYDAIGVVITVPAILSGVLNVLGWGIAVVYAFFAVGAGYVLSREKPLGQSQSHATAGV